MAQNHVENDLPDIHRFITNHNQKGEAVFSERNAELLPQESIQDVKFGLGYTTSNFPVVFTAERDIIQYEDYLKNKPGLSVAGGTVLRYVDMPPQHVSPMHRTASLDYGIVTQGEVELILDSGEKRLLRPGDVAIQRGTQHAWRNTSNQLWARMVYVLQEAEPFKIGDQVLGEDLGEIKGVRASDQRSK